MRAEVPSARSTLSARTSGVGRHSRRMSSTSPGTSIHGSADTSWPIRPMGNSGARSSGPIGSRVPGWSGGCSGSGMTGSTLNHALGMASSDRLNRAIFNGPFRYAVPPSGHGSAACPWNPSSSDAAVPVLGGAQDLVERLVALPARLAREPQHLLTDRVPLHLVGAAGDRVDAPVEEHERGRRAGSL